MTPWTPPSPAPQDAHWIDIVDVQGLCPPWRLGPFADAREAQRLARGVSRLVNPARFTVRVRPAGGDARGAGVQPATRTNASPGARGSTSEAKCRNAASSM